MLAIGRRAAGKGYRAVPAAMNNLIVGARAESSTVCKHEAVVGIFGAEAGMC